MIVSRISLVFIGFCFPILLVAQSEPFDFSPAFQNYTTDDGLPNNWIYDIVQDSKGYIWIATNYGICRYDGYEFKQFPDTLYANQTSVLTNSMMEDESGRMWFANIQGHLFYIENERILPYRYSHLLDSIRKKVDFTHGLIVEDNGDNVWIGFKNYGLVHVDSQGQITKLSPPHDSIEFQYFFKGEKFIKVTVPNLKNRRVENFLSTWVQKENEQYVLDPIIFKIPSKASFPYLSCDIGKDSLLFWNFEHLVLYKREKLLWEDYKPELAMWWKKSKEGGFWVGFKNDGLAYYSDLAQLRKGKKNSHYLHGLSVSVTLEDKAGGLWVGTQEQGIFYLPNQNSGIASYTFGRQGNTCNSMAFDENNSLLMGTSDGLVFHIQKAEKKQHEKAQFILNKKDFQPQYIFPIHYSPEQKTFGIPTNTRLAFFESERMRWFFPKGFRYKNGEIVRSGLRFLKPAKKKGQWYNCNSLGFEVLDFPSKTLVLDAADESGKKVRTYDLALDKSGQLWIAANTGLWEYKDKAYHRPENPHPALQQAIKSIMVQADNTLVLAPKGHGIVFWKKGQAVLEINSAQGLLPTKVNRIRFGAGGKVYGCTEQGLNVLFPDGKGSYAVQTFSLKNGLPSNAVHDVCEAWGELWLCTGKGLFKMPAPLPSPQRGEAFPSPFGGVGGGCVITALKINNKPIFQSKTLSFPHDSANVSIEFSALDYAANQQSTYRYRLRASQSDTSWIVGKNRSVNYSNLAPNDYRFEVAAQVGGGGWTAHKVLLFTIRAPWYATWWFRSALGLAVLGLGFFMYKYRTNQLKRETAFQKEIHNLERAALQAQMNPHFIFNCLNSIQKFILKNEKEEAASFLAKFAKLVRGALESSAAGEISLFDEVEMLDHYLSLEKLRFKEVFDFKIEIQEGLDTFDIAFPPMLVQPFVENAILHGMKGRTSGGRIGVHFFQKNDLLFVEVRDNGNVAQNERVTSIHLLEKPMPTNQPITKTSLGGKLTRRRLELMNDKNIGLSVEEMQNKGGTTVQICLGKRQ